MDVSSAPRQGSATASTSTPTTTPARAATPPLAPGVALPRGKPFAGVLAASRARAQVAPAHAKPVAKDGTSAEAELRRAPPVEGEQGSRGGREGESGRDGDEPAPAGVHDDAGRELELLDPATRQAAALAPPPAAFASPTSSEAPLRARSLEELLPALVRRIAWAGDKHKGTVHLELGAGAYAGTTVVVHADGGRVRVEISGSEGPELDRLRARLDGRLRGHGLDVESVT